jgi:hypothetical protein
MQSRPIQDKAQGWFFANTTWEKGSKKSILDAQDMGVLALSDSQSALGTGSSTPDANPFIFGWSPKRDGPTGQVKNPLDAALRQKT